MNYGFVVLTPPFLSILLSFTFFVSCHSFDINFFFLPTYFPFALFFLHMFYFLLPMFSADVFFLSFLHSPLTFLSFFLSFFLLVSLGLFVCLFVSFFSLHTSLLLSFFLSFFFAKFINNVILHAISFYISFSEWVCNKIHIDDNIEESFHLHTTITQQKCHITGIIFYKSNTIK